MKKNYIVKGIIVALCCLLLLKDALHLSVPVAFILCVMALWKRAGDMFLTQWHQYRSDIQKDFDHADLALSDAQIFLQNAKKNHSELEKTIDSILQSSHQEAAFLLKQAENEIMVMQESQRRQLEIQNTVLRQKWKVAMGQELIASIGTYVQTHSGDLPGSGNALRTVSYKITHAVDAHPHHIKERSGFNM